MGIDNYVEVSFPGFIDVVGAVNGVEVCLDKPIKDAFANVDLPAGCQTLAGKDALGYVRVRKIDNDLKRIERQQGFIAALASKTLSPAIMFNPFRATAVARAGGGALTVDSGMGPMDLLALARGGRGLASGASISTTVPVRDATIGGAAVLLPLDDAAALYGAFRDGSIFAQITGAAPTETASEQ
ncbi:MAG: anionic cell wall polymer biosynthesis LytR-Cps2A-Psr (LCP) family protein [Glaciecola sp.]